MIGTPGTVHGTSWHTARAPLRPHAVRAAKAASHTPLRHFDACSRSSPFAEQWPLITQSSCAWGGRRLGRPREEQGIELALRRSRAQISGRGGPVVLGSLGPQRIPRRRVAVSGCPPRPESQGPTTTASTRLRAIAALGEQQKSNGGRCPGGKGNSPAAPEPSQTSDRPGCVVRLSSGEGDPAPSDGGVDTTACAMPAVRLPVPPPAPHSTTTARVHRRGAWLKL